MSTAAAPRVIRSLPGRIRIHVPAMPASRTGALEDELQRIPGVARVAANPLTGNVLVEFDRDQLRPETILERLTRVEFPSSVAPSSRARATGRDRSAVLQTHSSARRARVAVHGLDRDPELGRRLVDRLSQRPEVQRVSPSPLTSRVLVELAEGTEDIQGILDDIAALEVPGSEARQEIPAHPLDTGPIVEGSAKTIGATLGLILISGRRLAGAVGAPIRLQGPGEVAGGISLVEGIPPVSHAVEDRLGHQRRELLLGVGAIVGMAASGSSIGLLFAGAAALRLVTESTARRSAWRKYEQRLGERPAVYPGAILTLSREERTPLAATVREGFGVFAGLDGSPKPLFPGQKLDPGARVYGSGVTVQLHGEDRFAAAQPHAPARTTSFDQYMRLVPYAAMLYTAVTGIVTGSPVRMLTGLLLVNPIPVLAGRESADRGASARVLRAGVTVVGSRPGRAITRPDVLVVNEPRTLCGGWELSRTSARVEGVSEDEIRALAGAISTSAGSPWGVTLPVRRLQSASDGTFDGRVASAEIDGERWLLESSGSRLAGAGNEPDELVLLLRRQRDGFSPGEIALRPHLTRGVAVLVESCRAAGVELELVSSVHSPPARRIASRAGIRLVAGRAEDRVSRLQASGAVVAVVGDSARSAPAFERCDLAIGLTSGLSGSFPARADLLAPRLAATAAIVEAGVRRDAAVRDAVLLAVAANAGGALWGALRTPPFRLGARPAQIGGLAAMAGAAWRLRGGHRARTVTERLSDPLPERWGGESIDNVLRELKTARSGLTSTEAQARWRPAPDVREQGGLLELMLEQTRSPLVTVLGVGAALSLAMGAVGDVAMIAAVVAANAAVGAWQTGRADETTRALSRVSGGTARVMRDGRRTTVLHTDLVPGDLLLLASGDRVAADARLIRAQRLEIDEAALTGESIPVVKSAQGGAESGRIVLGGTDVVAGTGRAVVVAVGEDTRVGAIAAALAEDPNHRQSPLDQRLGRMLVNGLPLVAAGGLVVTVAGLLWGGPLLAQLALGASVAIAAVPEGLPLIAGVAEAAVAQRLAKRDALVTRLATVEALGRVDVACVDKTGTLTTGTLALTLVGDAAEHQAPPTELTPDLREVLRAAAIASPAPDALDARSHPTDVAVRDGARAAGLREDLTGRRAESPFDPTRGFHATLADRRVRVKGAVEVLAERCTHVRLDDRTARLTNPECTRLLDRAAELAAQGLRILLVAEGPAAVSVDDPHGLTALGFIGISDPLRPGAAESVRRCRDAGVRVVMLTGDHPATAMAIARDAGLPVSADRLLTGEELAALDDETLAERLERTTVIARTMPLQKLRIVSILRDRGHVVAMTGDGVNDAPALRLADAGVAMGRAGTEVARQAADLVLMDDEFATLAEALVEGRGFWHNMRHALGLLLGGNAGEVGLMVASAVSGLASPLTTRQVLTVNFVTDVLPAISVAIQPPQHRNLAELSREGGGALDAPLHADIVRRGIATGVPSFGAYLLASSVISPTVGCSVAYISIVTTQLAQTVDLGWAEGRLTGSVLGAVGGSLAVVGATFALPPLRSFLALSSPTFPGLLIAAGASMLAVVLGRTVPAERWVSSGTSGDDRLLEGGNRATPRLLPLAVEMR